MTRRVMITGLGTVSGLGLNATTFWHALEAGHTGIRPFDLPIEGTKTTVAATIPGFNPDNYFSAKDHSLLDLFSQYAVVAAREAANDAGLVSGEKCLVDAAAIFGSACCGKQTDDEVTYSLYKQQRSRVHPFSIIKGMASAPASMVSTHLGIKGPAFVIASACSSGAHAIIQGMSMIMSGVVNVALVGGTDAPFNYSLLKCWDALRVMSNDTCRPFCKDRSGFVLGEGAGVLVLESEEHAIKRNASIYAEITGCAMNCSVPSNWLAVKHKRVSLVRSVCRVDALEFDRSMERLSDSKSGKSIQQALSLYTDDFLPNDNTPWTISFRDHLRKLFIDGVLRLASLQNTKDEVLLAFLEQALQSDPLHEGVYACLMEYYINTGFPAYALDIFHKAGKAIFLKTGLHPGAALQSLAEQAEKSKLSH